MTFATHYNVGTVTVTAGSAAVTGVGTFWTGNVAAGDILWVNGLSCRILSVNSNTSITLARNWPGATAAAAYYEAWAVLDAVGYQKKTGELLTKLSGGNLDALAGLTSAADRLPYFSGAGSAALTPFTAFDRALLGNANAAAFWASIGATAPPDRAFRRGNILDTVSQSGGVPTGGIIERGSNANGDYVRFADGTQIAWLWNTLASGAITTASGALYNNDSGNITWTLPAALVGGSISMGTHARASVRWITCASATSTLANFRVFSTVSSATSTPFDVCSIGRWF